MKYPILKLLILIFFSRKRICLFLKKGNFQLFDEKKIKEDITNLLSILIIKQTADFVRKNQDM